MNLKTRLLFLFFALTLLSSLTAQEVLRGVIKVEQEPIYGEYIDVNYPLDSDGAYRRALQEAAMFFSAQIYGWSFHYDVGEQARGIAEEFELTPLGEIPWGDPKLFVTHAKFENLVLSAWMDYRADNSQRRRIEMWKMGKARTAQAVGYGPWGVVQEGADWLSFKRKALEDSARAAVRAILQGTEKNRPKEVFGFISLQSFPTYFIEAGRWVVQARFKVEIKEIYPFAAY